MKKQIKNFLAKKENLYLTLALFFGFIMVFLNPPFAGVPDEHAHFWKAWSVADGYWRCSGHDMIPQTASTLPDSIKPLKIKGIDGKKIPLGKVKMELFAENNSQMVDIRGAGCPGTPFGYVPQVFGLRIGQSIGLSALATFYLARLFVLFSSVLLVWWAIKTIPFGKMILLVFGLMPMTIRQFSSLSYDALMIGFVMVFVAYILKLAAEPEKMITKKQIAFILFLILFGLNVKLGYFALTPLVFLLPKQKFPSVKKYWIFCVGLVLMSGLVFVGIRSLFVDIAVPTWTDPQAQMSYVLHNPVYSIFLVFDTIYGSKGALPYMEGILFKLGSGEALDWWVYIALMLGMIILVKNEKEEVFLTKKQRWIFIGTFLANLIMIHLALYIGWTEVGAERISGVQGRYLVPILPVLFLGLYKANFSLQFDWIKKHLRIFVILFFLYIFASIFYAIYKDAYDKSPAGQSHYESYLEESN
ncbi:MAG: DUF2142 domain-containing protein [bacterium]